MVKDGVSAVKIGNRCGTARLDGGTISSVGMVMLKPKFGKLHPTLHLRLLVLRNPVGNNRRLVTVNDGENVLQICKGLSKISNEVTKTNGGELPAFQKAKVITALVHSLVNYNFLQSHQL